MARRYTDKETYLIQATVSMLEEALEVVGNEMVHDIQLDTMGLSEDETVEYLSKIRKNIYTVMKTYPAKLEEEYEAHKADPEVQEAVRKMMEEASNDFESFIEEDDEDDNLQ